MRHSLGIASILTVAGGIALFAMLSDQAILPAGDIESARDIGRQSASTTLASDSAAESVRLSSVYKEILTVDKGDTLMAMLVDTGIAPARADQAVRTMSRIFKPRRIKPGQDIVLSLKPDLRAKSVELMAMKISPNMERDIVVTWTTNGFQAKTVDRPLTKLAMHARGEIDTSLYVAGVNAGLRQATLAKLIQAFSFDVDFQRDIRRGDAFDVMYEEYRDEDGAVVKSGDILVAELTSSGKTSRLYRFETKDGFSDFYDAKGQSVRKALLRTPIDGARISSNYGMRRHPILGYNKMHKGLDFAARRGTPIFAAGNGLVEYAGRNGGYGKYVRIRHNSTFKTAYAHMHRYGRGIRKGRRVKQGQIIGYVGSTGRSTGPHLHYEVHKNGRQVNPRSIKLPSGRKLKGRELRTFKAHMAALEKQYAALTAQKLADRR